VLNCFDAGIVRGMKLSIVIEMIDERAEAEPVAPIATHHDPRRQSERCRLSSNFVTQLAAAFLQSPEHQSREHLESGGAIQRYEAASVPTAFVSGTTICRKL